MLEVDSIYPTIKSKFPAAQIALYSTSREIDQDWVLNDSFVGALQYSLKKQKSNQ